MTAELDALFVMCAGPAGAIRLEWDENGRREHTLIDCGDLPRFRRLCAGLSAQHDLWAGVQPRAAQGGLTGRCYALWCVAEGNRSVEKLRRLRPVPTLLVQQGDNAHVTALWALERGLTWDYVVKGNRRLAHAVGGPKKYAEPEHMVRVPGSFLRDRIVPLPVRAQLNPGALYTARAVVGRLRDAPSPDAWRDRKEAA